MGARDLLWAWHPPMFKHAGFRLELDPRVLMFTAGISLATGVLFGLAPAFRATRRNLAADLKERAGVPDGFHQLWRPRAALVVAQVAFSLVALIGAGLFARSLRSAGQIDPGFDAAHLGIVAYNVTDQGYNEVRGREYHQRAVETAKAVHGVVSAALGRDGPFHVASTRMVLLEGEANTATRQGRSTLNCCGRSASRRASWRCLAAWRCCWARRWTTYTECLRHLVSHEREFGRSRGADPRSARDALVPPPT